MCHRLGISMTSRAKHRRKRVGAVFETLQQHLWPIIPGTITDIGVRRKVRFSGTATLTHFLLVVPALVRAVVHHDNAAKVWKASGRSHRR